MRGTIFRRDYYRPVTRGKERSGKQAASSTSYPHGPLKRLLFIGFLLFFCVFTGFYASALETEADLVKLILHEKSGRFSVYFWDKTRGTSTPLLVDQDPKTSTASLLIGNKIYRLGDSSAFKQQISKTSNGAQISWQNKQYSITQEFSFVVNKQIGLVDGFYIDFTIENNSAGSEAIGLRYVLDTYLGEKGVHFQTDSAAKIDRETVYYRHNLPAYWISLDKKDDLGLECVFDVMDNSVTKPDKIVFANWKRINDSGWAFNENSTRNFNLLPYSINDSAVTLYYDPVQVAVKSARKIRLYLKLYDDTVPTREQQPVLAPGSPLAEAIQEEQGVETARATEAQAALSSLQDQVESDLSKVKEILKRIDELLSSTTDLDEDEISAIKAALDELLNRKSQYEKR